MEQQLKGKTAFITGAGGGLGREVAVQLGQLGVCVAAADFNLESAQRTADLIVNAGGKALAVPVDVSNTSEVKDALAKVNAAFGPADFLINIAGHFQAGRIQDISDEQWQRMMDVHLGGTFRCCRAALDQMIERRSGRIVNIASVQAYGAGFGYLAPSTHYATAKAGIIGFTKSLAREVGPSGVTVNVVAPTATETALWRGDTPPAELEQRRIDRAKLIPLGRIAMPEDVAGAIIFLLGPSASFITGHVVNLTGGELMM